MGIRRIELRLGFCTRRIHQVKISVRTRSAILTRLGLARTALFRASDPSLFHPTDFNRTIIPSNVNGKWQTSSESKVVLNYTWSHALADVPGQYAAPQNTSDIHAEYGPADIDRRHVFSGSYVYRLRFYRPQHGLSSTCSGVGKYQVSRTLRRVYGSLSMACMLIRQGSARLG